MSTDLAPASPTADPAAVLRWVADQTPLVQVVDAAVAALAVEHPYLNLGPAYYGRDNGKPAHLLRGATWFLDKTNVGFRVEFFGPRLRIHAWGVRLKITIDLFEVTPQQLAHDLWTALTAAGFADEPEPEHLTLVNGVACA